MKSARVIGFWHGRSSSLVDKIAKICKYDPVGEFYYWDGSLDEFAKQYKDKFLVYSDAIYVTSRLSWSPA